MPGWVNTYTHIHNMCVHIMYISIYMYVYIYTMRVYIPMYFICILCLCIFNLNLVFVNKWNFNCIFNACILNWFFIPSVYSIEISFNSSRWFDSSVCIHFVCKRLNLWGGFCEQFYWRLQEEKHTITATYILL